MVKFLTSLTNVSVKSKLLLICMYIRTSHRRLFLREFYFQVLGIFENKLVKIQLQYLSLLVFASAKLYSSKITHLYGHIYIQYLHCIYLHKLNQVYVVIHTYVYRTSKLILSIYVAIISLGNICVTRDIMNILNVNE